MSFNSALIWSTLGLLAWLAFDLTAQPAIVAAILCTRIGWTDIRTALWLRRNDTNLGRGRACSWFCFSRGVGKIVLMAGILSFVAVYLACREPLDRGVPRMFWGPLILMLIGAPMVAALALAGCCSAKRNNVRVWIDDKVYYACREKAWPPRYLELGLGFRHRNMVDAPWCWMHIATWMVSLGVGTFVGFSFASLPLGAAVFAFPVFAVTYLSRGVVAENPDQCWRDVVASAITTSVDDRAERE